MSRAILLQPAPAAGEDRPLASREPRSWLAQAMLTALGRRAAKVGFVWVVLVAALAVLAPFLANSYPLLIKIDGRWSSPLLRYLSAIDVILLAAALTALALLPMRRLRGYRLVAFGGVMIPASLAALLLVHPPARSTFEQYRELEAAGRVQYVLRAPLPYSPTERLPGGANPHPWKPSRQHPFGTERNGADILSGMIHATRIAMSIGFVSTGIAIVVGTIIGGLMGYFVRWVDLLGMRLVEMFAAIPTLYLLLACVAFLKPHVKTETGLIYLFMVIIGLTGWVGYARFTRAEFLRLRNQDFVHAAVAAGLPLRSVLFRHILPNAVAPILVSASFGIASAILAEATISFLGLGLVDEPSWGKFLNQAISPGGGFYWWLATFPGLAIFLTVFSYNLIGEALRDAIDPKLRK